MSRRQYRVSTDFDLSGVVGAFVFGAVVGVFLVYPSLPGRLQAIQPGSTTITLGPVAAPLLGGVALFMLFFMGVFLLNWLFIEAND